MSPTINTALLVNLAQVMRFCKFRLQSLLMNECPAVNDFYTKELHFLWTTAPTLRWVAYFTCKIIHPQIHTYKARLKCGHIGSSITYRPLRWTHFNEKECGRLGGEQTMIQLTTFTTRRRAATNHKLRRALWEGRIVTWFPWDSNATYYPVHMRKG